jgi:nucleoside-diphosphate-sugar epimerase
VIFGGAGFIGTHLAQHFLKTGRFSHVHLADIRKSPLEGQPGISCSTTDVRESIPSSLIDQTPEWIFNLAAIHREPGHEAYEYFDTNLAGARNVCEYAEAVSCSNIYFTSSIAVYGPTTGPTSESSPIQPTTPYGGSKYPAECIHQGWRRAGEGRRLMISRPGVVYGPGDPGNIMRMLRAIKKGYFAYPGNPDIKKSYAYIFGFIESVEFVMDRDDPEIICNYVETPTQPLKGIVEAAKKFLDCKALVFPLPLWFLVPASRLVQAVLGSRNPVHPVRVRKAATSTHIIPQTLLDLRFKFKYDFLSSLEHWRATTPEDFEFAFSAVGKPGRLKLIKDSETDELRPDGQRKLSAEEELNRES